MKSLREVESVIFATDCIDCLNLGWYRSQPILTKDENGNLIDNYFMYGRNLQGTLFYVPYVVFGIYSDEKKTAYITEIPKEDVTEYTPKANDNNEIANKAYARYEELYPLIRECAYSECDEKQKNAVNEYLTCLETYSGPIIWNTYKKLFPSFFEWAQSL